MRFRIVTLNNYTKRSDHRILTKLEPLGSLWEYLPTDIDFVEIQRLDFPICVKQIKGKTAPVPRHDLKRRLIKYGRFKLNKNGDISLLSAIDDIE